jgi:hypothetical protein
MATIPWNQATALTAKTLVSARPTGTASTAMYTVGASKAAKLGTGSICNTSTTATVNVTLAIVPSGGTDDGTHTVIAAYPLAPGDTLALQEYIAGHMLGEGDFIAVTASVTSVIDVVITGTEAS